MFSSWSLPTQNYSFCYHPCSKSTQGMENEISYQTNQSIFSLLQRFNLLGSREFKVRALTDKNSLYTARNGANHQKKHDKPWLR